MIYIHSLGSSLHESQLPFSLMSNSTKPASKPACRELCYHLFTRVYRIVYISLYIYPLESLETCLLRYTEPPPCHHMMIYSGAPRSMMFVPGEAEVNEHQMNVPVSHTLLNIGSVKVAFSGAGRNDDDDDDDDDDDGNLGSIGCLLSEVQQFQSRHSIQLFLLERRLVRYPIQSIYNTNIYLHLLDLFGKRFNVYSLQIYHTQILCVFVVFCLRFNGWPYFIVFSLTGN